MSIRMMLAMNQVRRDIQRAQIVDNRHRRRAQLAGNIAEDGAVDNGEVASALQRQSEIANIQFRPVSSGKRVVEQDAETGSRHGDALSARARAIGAMCSR
jgi:hypothetical protein